ncbi:MAG TPA: response regulator [Methylocystis sp.]|nr:response regulator [Methylocystis sp.]
MTGQRVLVVDDEPEIIRCLRPALAACGYDVLAAETGREALLALASRAPDVVVLDLGLPDMDGKDVIGQARAFSKAPIIVLSARDREAEKIAALDAGAADYVEKPFAIGELMARLRAAMRHATRDGDDLPRIERGGLVIDLVKRIVTKHGTPVKLTPKEYELLALLARGNGRLLTHKQLLTSVWGPAHRDDSQYLRVFIGQLRAKIEDEPANPKLILTELGAGYRFAEAEG